MAKTEQIQMTRVDFTNSEVELVKSGLMKIDTRKLGFSEEIKDIFRKLRGRSRTPGSEIQKSITVSRGPVNN